jgi:hypothetical protein
MTKTTMGMEVVDSAMYSEQKQIFGHSEGFQKNTISSGFLLFSFGHAE